MPSFTFYIGLTAGILTSVAALPQLIKLVREKHAEDISLAMFGVLLAGLVLWIWYGIVQDDIPIIWTNVLSFSINSTVILLSVRYKRKAERMKR